MSDAPQKLNWAVFAWEVEGEMRLVFCGMKGGEDCKKWEERGEIGPCALCKIGGSEITTVKELYEWARNN